MLNKKQLFLSHVIAILSSSLVVCEGTARAQRNAIRLASPSGQIVFTFRVNDTASYNVSYKNKPIITNGSMSFSFLETGEFKKNLKTARSVFRKGEENYELIVGKIKFVHQPFQEVVIPIEQSKAPFTRINLQVRAFDDGIAFRYEFPAQKNWTQFSLTDEHTNFNLVGDPDVLALLLPNYSTSHEGEYTHSSLSKLKEDTLLDMPALFTFPGPTYLAITEAALLDYAGMYLVREGNTLTSSLSPLPGQTQVKVEAKLPHYSPWRVLMISDRVGALIESNILTSLNEPCKINDLSWIKPGKTTFPWWNGNVVPDTLNAPGNNFVTNQYYIDFCSRNGLEYHSVVEYGLHQWYMDDGVNFQPGPHADVTTPVPGLDMKQICNYANQHGVGHPRVGTLGRLVSKVGYGFRGL